MVSKLIMFQWAMYVIKFLDKQTFWVRYNHDLKKCIFYFLLQHESLLLQQPQSQQGNNPQLEELKSFKNVLDRFLSFVQISKSNIQMGYKDKLDSYEKQIINSNRPQKPIPPMQLDQSLIPSNVPSMLQSQRQVSNDPSAAYW